MKPSSCHSCLWFAPVCAFFAGTPAGRCCHDPQVVILEDDRVTMGCASHCFSKERWDIERCHCAETDKEDAALPEGVPAPDRIYLRRRTPPLEGSCARCGGRLRR